MECHFGILISSMPNPSGCTASVCKKFLRQSQNNLQPALLPFRTREKIDLHAQFNANVIETSVDSDFNN